METLDQLLLVCLFTLIYLILESWWRDKHDASSAYQLPRKKIHLFKEYTRESLEKESGTDCILVALCGKVFDVSSAEKFYGKNGPYSCFAGKDATLMLAKNSFQVSDQDQWESLDQIEKSLSESELKSLKEWLAHFERKYIYMEFLHHNDHSSHMLRIGRTVVAVDQFLAEGGFARVFLGHLHDSPNIRVAVKYINTSPDSQSYASILQEVELMKTFQHKNIVQFIDSSVAPKAQGGYDIMICMEYCSGGQLVDLMNQRISQGRRFTEQEIVRIFGDVCEAVEYLHHLTPPVIHRDLKVENILIQQGVFKLCDFGSCTRKQVPVGTALKPQEISMIQEELDTLTTLQYRAPEMCDLYKRRGLTEKVDIWALGVLLYKLCFFITPFENEGKLAILNNRYQLPPPSPQNTHGIQYSQNLLQLIRMLLTDHPSQRPSIDDVLATMRGQPAVSSNTNNSAQRSDESLNSPLQLPVLPPKDFPRYHQLQQQQQANKRAVNAQLYDMSNIIAAAGAPQNNSNRRGRVNTSSNKQQSNTSATAVTTTNDPNVKSPTTQSVKLDDLFGGDPFSANATTPPTNTDAQLLVDLSLTDNSNTSNSAVQPSKSSSASSGFTQDPFTQILSAPRSTAPILPVISSGTMESLNEIFSNTVPFGNNNSSAPSQHQQQAVFWTMNDGNSLL